MIIGRLSVKGDGRKKEADRVNQHIYNTNANPLAISSDTNINSYQTAILLGEAYRFNTTLSAPFSLINLLTKYATVRLNNPSVSTKNIFINRLKIVRSINNLGLNVMVNTDMALYSEGVVSGTVTSITPTNINPSFPNASVLGVTSSSPNTTNPFSGGSKIQDLYLIDTTYEGVYQGEFVIPPGSSLTLLITVGVISVSLSGSIDFNISYNYWQENV